MFRNRSTTHYDDPAVAQDAVVDRDETVRAGAVWNPAQMVALVIGGAAIVFGIVALARTGLDTDHWYTPVDRVLGFPHSPLLAVCEIGFGVLMVLSAIGPAGRPLMAMLSAIALAFGILIVVDAWASDINRWFGVLDRNGWLYIIVGAVGLVSALMLPTVHGRDVRHVHERRHFGRPHTAH